MYWCVSGTILRWNLSHNISVASWRRIRWRSLCATYERRTCANSGWRTRYKFHINICMHYAKTCTWCPILAVSSVDNHVEPSTSTTAVVVVAQIFKCVAEIMCMIPSNDQTLKWPHRQRGLQRKRQTVVRANFVGTKNRDEWNIENVFEFGIFLMIIIYSPLSAARIIFIVHAT